MGNRTISFQDRTRTPYPLSQGQQFRQKQMSIKAKFGVDRQETGINNGQF